MKQLEVSKEETYLEVVGVGVKVRIDKKTGDSQLFIHDNEVASFTGVGLDHFSRVIALALQHQVWNQSKK